MKSNSPLLWYLLDTTSSLYNKALKKKLINKDNIYSSIIIIFNLSSVQIILIMSNFSIRNEQNIVKIFLWSTFIALEKGNSLILSSFFTISL